MTVPSPPLLPRGRLPVSLMARGKQKSASKQQAQPQQPQTTQPSQKAKFSTNSYSQPQLCKDGCPEGCVCLADHPRMLPGTVDLRHWEQTAHYFWVFRSVSRPRMHQRLACNFFEKTESSKRTGTRSTQRQVLSQLAFARGASAPMLRSCSNRSSTERVTWSKSADGYRYDAKNTMP